MIKLDFHIRNEETLTYLMMMRKHAYLSLMPYMKKKIKETDLFKLPGETTLSKEVIERLRAMNKDKKFPMKINGTKKG